jgi:pectin methylesterase-like acyl-CoA thioesterase
MSIVKGFEKRRGSLRLLAQKMSRLCLLALPLAAVALPLSEGFENAVPPAGWITFSTPAAGPGWVRSDSALADWGFSAQAPASGFASPPAAHWLISPPLRPDSRHDNLSFFLRGSSSATLEADSLLVLVSLGGGQPADFSYSLLTIALSEISSADSFQPFSASLQPWSEDTLLVAFVFAQASDSTFVWVDSVSGPPLALPVEPSNPDPPDGSVGVGTEAMLQWQNGLGTLTVDLYLSLSQSEIESLSLAARVLTSAPVSAYQPPSHFVTNRTYYWRVVAHGEDADAPGPVWSFAAGVGALGGTYTIGPSGEFNTFGEALAALGTQGISAPTEFAVMPGQYSESLEIGPIAGSGPDAALTFRRAVPESSVTIVRSNAPDTTAIALTQASFVTLDGIDVTVSGGSTRHGIVLTGSSSNNTVRRAVVNGPGATVANSDGVFLAGPGCNDNTFDSVTVRRAVRGFNLQSPAGSTCTGNVIRNSRADSVRCGAYLLRQAACHVQGCELSINAGAYDETDGIVVATTMPGDTVFVHENRISGLTTSGAYAVGLRVKTDSAAAVVRACNNAIYDFRNTGSSQVRALYITSGRCELVANSLLANDVSSSGTSYAVYIGSLGSSGRITLLNNIFSNRESSNAAYNVFAFSTTTLLESDYNIFHGTGAGYRLGRWGSDCVTLSAWRAATGGDAHSLEGDPGFTGATDLHLLATYGLAHQNGAVVPYVTCDMDGEPRLRPPDRGADEYVYDAPAADFALLGFVDLESSYVEYTSVPIRVVVQNRGSEIQRGVPVQLLCNGDLQDEWQVSLLPLTVDTLTLVWNTGGGDSVYTLRAQCVLEGDAEPVNDTVSVAKLVLRPPLGGEYLIGSGGDSYPTFSAAIQDLAVRGVTEPVTFEIAPGSYNEPMVIPYIPGASVENCVTFRPASSRSIVTISSDTGPATIVLDGADHVVLENLNVIATGANNEGIRLTGDADSNLISGVVLSGPSLLITTAVGVHSVSGGNDGNVIRETTVQDFYYGLRLEGTAAGVEHGNRVEHCTLNSSRMGIRTDYQDGTHITSNTVRTGYDGAAIVCHGIFIGSQSAGSVVFAEANRLVEGRGAAGACGVYANSGAGLAKVFNNMISGWNVSGAGPVWGILIAGGSAQVHFNSLWMNDIAGSGNVIAIADTGSAAVLTARDNAIQITESTNPSWCIYRGAGSVDCDYTAFGDLTGGNPQFRLGKWGAVDCSTLVQWQAVSGMDAHGLSGVPGFSDSLNLHVQAHMPLLNASGVTVTGITQDYDDETRGSPPDIGADEYTYGIYQRNFMTRWVEPLPQSFSSQTDCSVAVGVTNVGFEAQNGVPLQLFYRDTIVAETVVSLLPQQTDTVLLDWRTPATGLEQGTLRAQTFLDGDEVPDNDAVSVTITIIGPPLAGSYDCGGGGWDFASPLESVAHLTLRGVSDSVVIRLYPGTYSDSLHLSAIAGAGATRRVIFRGTGAEPGSTVLTCSSGEAVLRMEGTRYATFENLSVIAAGNCTTAVLLVGGACGNEFRDCSVRGADSALSYTTAMRLETDANDSNLVERVTIGGAYTGVAFQGGPTGSQGHANVIRDCTIRHARHGVYISHQVACQIDGNDIQPGSASDLAAACYGVYVTALGSGGSALVCNNRIHDFADSSVSTTNRAVGIYAAAAAGGAVFAFNNFIYGFEGVDRLKISAFYLSSGENVILHNSVLVDDAPTTNEISAVYVSSGTSHTLKNNILVVREDDVTSYGVLQMAGNGLVCNGNDLWGSSSRFVAGRIAGVNYASFALWQAAGYDLNGLSADPGFVSDDDLHILDTVAVVDGRGLPTGFVSTDIDGDLRGTPPDIGADEYHVYLALDSPSALTVSVEGDNIRLSWQSVAGARSYHVYADSLPGFLPAPGLLAATTADTTVLLSWLGDNETVRFFAVTADHNPVSVGMSRPRERAGTSGEATREH